MSARIVPQLLTPLSFEFGSTLIERGSRYFAQGKCKVIDSSERLARLAVNGSELYMVEVSVEPFADHAEVDIDCDCPYSEREGICKHGWCALLLLCAKEWPALTQASSLRWGPDFGEDEFEEDLDEDLDDELSDEELEDELEALFWESSERDELGSGGLGRSHSARVPHEVLQNYRFVRERFDTRTRHDARPVTPLHYVLDLDSPTGLRLRPCDPPSNKGTVRAVVDVEEAERRCPTPQEALFLHRLLFADWDLDEILREDAPHVLQAIANERRLLVDVGDGRVQAVRGSQQLARFSLVVTDTRKAPHAWKVTGTLDWDDPTTTVSDFEEPGWWYLGGPLFLYLPPEPEQPTYLVVFSTSDEAAWFRAVRDLGSITVERDDQDEFITDVLERGSVRVTLPDLGEVERKRVAPEPVLRLRDDRGLKANVAFAYGAREVDWADERPALFSPESKSVVMRDGDAEARALAFLGEAGFTGRGLRTEHTLRERGEIRLKKTLFLPAVTRLLEAGWTVYGEKGRYRSMTSASMRVESGMDWFDLHGTLEFSNESVALPQLLRALKKKGSNGFVVLDDGSLGLIPESWLARLAHLKGSAQSDGALRFSLAQVGVVRDLSQDAERVYDERFASLCDVLFGERASMAATGDGAQLKLPAGFRGTLRPYQRQGVAWLDQILELGFGACLADDMGLGKTVQVLALLWSRSRPKTKRGSPARKRKTAPTLIVAPRSLVENWAEEAARFCPALDVQVHLGPERDDDGKALSQHDVIVTSFATLRQDADLLTSIDYDLVVVDEAQNMKNASAQATRVIKSLEARQRIALTGTPVENHLGDLWSIFDFLNPGMLGYLGRGQAAPTRLDAAAQRLLQAGVRPFLLRRTKAQVATDLPERTEQEWRIDLPADHRKTYDELAQYYRKRIAEAKSDGDASTLNTLILEALTRLRQAACDPGLLDQNYPKTSVKVTSLCESLETLREEGRKALVFSQFTSFLKRVKSELIEREIPFEYLDGGTTKRPQVIERFRKTPDCTAFLISLKAGGVGLNLTEADTVFLLDPWWNPAAEAQAIDRTHRIGQVNPVFAWRLIARDTIEEKVIELQHGKRDLARAVLEADATNLKMTQAEILELLQ